MLGWYYCRASYNTIAKAYWKYGSVDAGCVKLFLVKSSWTFWWLLDILKESLELLNIALRHTVGQRCQSAFFWHSAWQTFNTKMWVMTAPWLNKHKCMTLYYPYTCPILRDCSQIGNTNMKKCNFNCDHFGLIWRVTNAYFGFRDLGENLRLFVAKEFPQGPITRVDESKLKGIFNSLHRSDLGTNFPVLAHSTINCGMIFGT